MNRRLQTIEAIIQQNESLTAEQKDAILKSLNEVDKELEVTLFKLDRTEKVKKTTAILLEETILELEQKRKAVEEQNRELEIEAALERVRAAAMAMHKSEDVNGAVGIVFEELDKLNLGMLRCGIAILNKEKRSADVWSTTKSDKGLIVQVSGDESIDIHPMLAGAFGAWVNHEEDYTYDLYGDDLIKYYKSLDTTNFNLPEELHRISSDNGMQQHFFVATFSAGCLFAFRQSPFPEEAKRLMKRFANVFNLTYKRFLDLQKAEAQAREAKIEAALERVRAAAMAMHKSDDLHGAVKIMFEEFQKLNLDVLRCGVGILNNDSRTGTVWATSVSENGLAVQISANESFDTHPLMMRIYEYWQKQEDLAYVLQGQDLIDYYRAMDESELKLPTSQLRSLEDELKPQYYYGAMFNAGGLYAFRGKPFTAEDIKLMKRFANVLNLTYNRFLDLQKAEAQAREAHIEAALERVRSKAMAMHKSEDLNLAVAVVFDELENLGLGTVRCGIGILSKEKRTTNLFTTSKSDAGTTVQLTGDESMDLHPLQRGSFNAWLNGQDFSYVLKGKEIEEFYRAGADTNFNLPESQRLFTVDEGTEQYYHVSMFQSGGLYAFRDSEFPEEAKRVMKRFAGVFNLTYNRFLDLQKAEAQARESQIEAALERVRSRTMAMHKSEELNEVNTTIIQQIKSLHISLYAFGIHICHANEPISEAWMGDPVGGYMPRVIYDHSQDPLSVRMYAGWKEGKILIEEKLSGDALKEHFNYMITLVPDRSIFDNMVAPESLVFHFAYFKYGFFVFLTQEHCPEEHSFIKRLAKVFEQTYTRFLDLQKAEAQAREAQIEAALEKVRSRSLAMHKSDELKDVVHSVFERLSDLKFELDTAIIIIFKEGSKDTVWWLENKKDQQHLGIAVKYADIYHFRNLFEAKEKRKDLISSFYAHEEKNELLNYLFNNTDYQYTPKKQKEFLLRQECAFISVAIAKNTGIHIRSSEKPLSEAQNDILIRFSKVFDQAYTRFLDLQKAEAQAREAQIEAALEKVRSRTMAMQKSEELRETAAVLFQQFKHLGEDIKQITIGIVHEQEGTIEITTTDPAGSGSQVNRTDFLSIEEPTVIKKLYVGWKEKKNFITIELSGSELQQWIRYRNSIYQIAVSNESILGRRIVNAAFFSRGHISISTLQECQPGTIDLLQRFAGVFDLTYTRFLDLQKAEAQAKEAQIEAALERVRSRTMAMHKSEEVMDVAGTLFEELQKLGFTFGASSIIIMDKDSGNMEYWIAGFSQEKFTESYPVKYFQHPYHNALLSSWNNGEKYLVYTLAGEEKKAYDEVLFTETGYKNFPQEEKKWMRETEAVIFSIAFMKHGALHWGPSSLTEEQANILQRFANVFEQSYTRFLDLQKAEAQAREAQIEAALERVRGKAMAMHKSDDLHSVVRTIFNQLRTLKLGVLRCGIGIFNKDKRTGDVWSTSMSDEESTVQISGDESFDIHPLLQGTFDAWLEQKDFYYVLKANDLKSYYRELSKTNFNLPDPGERKLFKPESPQYYYTPTFKAGNLYAYSESPFTEDYKNVLKRFAAVVNLTYNRFLDLQKAEAQARESQIEAALERVRGKAMAMHSSQDLSETVNVFFKELKLLGIVPVRCGVNELDEESRTSTVWVTTAFKQGDSHEVIGKIKLSGHPVLEKIFEGWKMQQEYYPVLSGADLKEYYKFMKPHLSFPHHPDSITQYGSYFYFKEGLVFAWTEKELSEEEKRIFRRFTAVISLTYRRYMELQKSEAAAKDAVRQASLDRIRAEIASMRTTKDLERITPLIWNELTITAVPFIRCGVFIMDDSQQLMHTFLSTPDGKAIAAFHLQYNTPGNIGQIVKNWQDKKIYIDHWDEKAFKQFANSLIEQGALKSSKQYLSTLPKGDFYLHFLPFQQGMLYVGNTTRLGEEEIKLLQSVADAFSTAYARYEDFNKLEAAKQQVDKTLVELKQTQTQLIQSEKMASLGELTAGIAHEIQNPLNFVNNFSEVNKELLEEMAEEIEKGNYDAAKVLAKHVEDNQEKINHHGKRAEAIVKGMLQHSRSSSGKKEPTDINALADEYLRLAYHGLRAKDKTFNATMKTNFDQSIGNINIISQDVGRVILNLITNAFYEVTEKKKQVPDYEPVVTVATKRLSSPSGDGGKVLISVKDNGNGIPPKVLNKIFQPFFTTKPTGQGTGLGLSLSYDIIKSHGGEIKVETKQGEGTEFTLTIPGF